MDEETWEATDEAFRDLTVGEAVRDEAEENPIIAEWLLALLDRRVTSASDRQLFGLPPLGSPGLELVKDGDAGILQRPTDAMFHRQDGIIVALPWADLREWAFDTAGNRLIFIWPRVDVVLTGRHLDKLMKAIQRRCIGEFRQASPEEAATIAEGETVIEIMEFDSSR